MRHILSLIKKADQKFNLIENNDKIAVGVSGGKDSLILLKALNIYKKFNNKNFDIVAITIDSSNGKQDFSDIKKFCFEENINYIIKKTNIFEVVFNERKEKNPCSLCSKMRKGALNEEAKIQKCNKVALGHNADDLIETFIMSINYEERLNTIWPKLYLTNTELTIIRPLCLVKESKLIAFQNELNLKVVKNMCGIDKKTKREETKNCLKKIDKILPNFSDKILSSILRTDKYNLLKEMENTNNINLKLKK